jgi:hypothetical protein
MPHWPADVRPLTDSGLDEALDSPSLVGIHCWAPWNGHDHIFAREMIVIREGFGGGIDLYSMNFEDPSNAPLGEQWNVLNVPAFVIFRQGRWVQTFYQSQESVPELLQRIVRWLAAASGVGETAHR